MRFGGRPNESRAELFCLSFIGLFLELMVIRWEPAAVRMIAYYANLMLISSFLGLGVGAMIGKRYGSLFGWLPGLLLLHVVSLVVTQLLMLPGTAAESRFYASNPKLWNYGGLIAIFLTNALVFTPLGQRIGALFEVLPPLQAYSWDLGGSLAGTICFGLFSFLSFSPKVGVGLVAMAIILFLPRGKRGRSVPLLIMVMVGVWISDNPNAFWSPYYYINVMEVGKGKPVRLPHPNLRTMQDPPTYSVSVNHDFYQPHGTVDPGRYSPALRRSILDGRLAYDLPYALAPAHKRVLVLGSGGGTDSEVAVLNGAESVDAVEIDPMLVELSGKFNASAIYENPKVRVHINDARAYLRSAAGGYDMVVFGWLDSQALFSSMSNLRLDGYIYTVESMQSAYALLKQDGMLSLSFMAGHKWLAQKLVRMVKDATGKMPAVYQSNGQVVICAWRGQHRTDPPLHYGRFERSSFLLDDDMAGTGPPTDDWPFLYLHGRTIPPDYLIVIGTLLALCLPAVFLLRGSRFSLNDGHFLFLGMGFMLLETKSISDCSLYFGTTWLVTMIVVSGVLLMVLASNLVAMRLRKFRMWMYAPLIATLFLLYFVDRNTILSLSYNARLLWSLLVVPLPIFFAGLIFATTFREGRSPSALFGANLIGAMIGGFCEYLCLLTGNGTLMLLVIVAYLVSLGLRARLRAFQT